MTEDDKAEVCRVGIEREAFTIDEFAWRHAIGRDMVYAEIHAGRLRSYTLGKKRLIGRKAADEWQSEVEKKVAPVTGLPPSLVGRSRSRAAKVTG
jgi:excisionase family DNA binding protein